MIRIRYYGWPLVGVGFLFYGLGIAPAYYSWGFFAPEIIEELGISRQQVGEIFGTFALVLSLTSMVSAAAINRFGLRITVTVGAVIASVGWYAVGKAESLLHLYISYALIGGFGLGLSTLMPAQTLPVFWFRRYRARATAIIFFGAAVFGAIVIPLDSYILEDSGWRAAWVYISIVSFSVAIISALLLRNRPEDIGQYCDGDPSWRESHFLKCSDVNREEKMFSLKQAIMTPQFAIATLADIANAVPWRIITVHGRLHMENLGFAPALAAAILGVRVGMSGLGRLSGSLSDFTRPGFVMALALMFTAFGVGGLWCFKTSGAAYFCVVLMGIGYGAAFTTIPVIFGNFFGRRAFVGTAGLRVAITGVVGFFGVSWAGAVADKYGTYNPVLIALAALCAGAAVLIFLCKAPVVENKLHANKHV